MTLDQIQAWVHGRVAAHAALVAATVPIIDDDGTYPKTPTLEEKRQQKGLVLVIWEPDSEGLGDVSVSGHFTHELYVPVIVEENVKVNRAAPGTTIPALRAAQHVLEACSGQKPSSTSPFTLVPMDPPFKNFGRVNGLNRIVVNLKLTQSLTPILAP